MAIVLAIVQFSLVPILLVVALAVRFAGGAKPLNVVDYARVSDPVALDRWAGNRLLVLPLVFLVGGYISYAFIVTIGWNQYDDCTAAFELSLSEAKTATKRLKQKLGYDPQIFERVQTCLASLEGKASEAHRKAIMGAV